MALKKQEWVKDIKKSKMTPVKYLIQGIKGIKKVAKNTN
jgi:hypothetical protein